MANEPVLSCQERERESVSFFFLVKTSLNVSLMASNISRTTHKRDHDDLINRQNAIGKIITIKYAVKIEVNIELQGVRFTLLIIKHTSAQY